MSKENLTWGAQWIEDEMRMLGIEVSESTVGRYMIRIGRPALAWLENILAQSRPGNSCDRFVARIISFRLLMVW